MSQFFPRRRPNSSKYVSASQLAALGYCETKFVLDGKHGERVTKEQQAARNRGNHYHEQFHERAVKSHNARPDHRTGPCFIATAVYGSQDPRTNELRRFRDLVLQPSPWGRGLIKTYYTISPPIAAWIGRHPAAVVVVRKSLDLFRSTINFQGRR